MLLQLIDSTLVEKVADEAVRKHMSVAQLEELVDQTNVPMVKEETAPGTLGRSQCARRKPRWSARWECECASATARKGKIVIEYSTLEDFDRVVEMLKGR